MYTNRNWSGGARRLNLALDGRQPVRVGTQHTLIFRDAFESITGIAPSSRSRRGGRAPRVRQPWFLSPRNEGAVSASRRAAARRGSSSKHHRRTGEFTREVAIRAPTSLTYRFELHARQRGDVYFCVNYGVCDILRSRRSSANSGSRAAALTGTIDRTIMRSTRTVAISCAPTSSMRPVHGLGLPLQSRGGGWAVYRRIAAGWCSPPPARLVWGPDAPSTGLTGGACNRRREHPSPRSASMGWVASVRGYQEGQLGRAILTIPPELLIQRGCVLEVAGDRDLHDTAINSSRSVTTSSRPDRRVGIRSSRAASRCDSDLENLGGAAVVDGAIVGEGSLRDVTRGAGAITPGVGIRYYSPVGPIRIDLGFNPNVSEDLGVLTQVSDGVNNDIVRVQQRDASGNAVPVKRSYAPAKNEGGLRGFLNQLTLHLSSDTLLMRRVGIVFMALVIAVLSSRGRDCSSSPARLRPRARATDGRLDPAGAGGRHRSASAR